MSLSYFTESFHKEALQKLCRLCGKIIPANSDKSFECDTYKCDFEIVLNVQYVDKTDPNRFCMKCYLLMKCAMKKGKATCFVKRLWNCHSPLQCDICSLFKKQLSGGRPTKSKCTTKTTEMHLPEIQIGLMEFSDNTNIVPLSNIYNTSCGVCAMALTPCSVFLGCGHPVCFKCVPLYCTNNIVKCSKCIAESSMENITCISSYLQSLLLCQLCICKLCSQTGELFQLIKHSCINHQTVIYNLPDYSNKCTNTDPLPNYLEDPVSFVSNHTYGANVHTILARWLPALENENGIAKVKGHSGRVSILSLQVIYLFKSVSPSLLNNHIHVKTKCTN